MYKIDVKSSSHNYQVVFESGLNSLVTDLSFFIIDRALSSNAWIASLDSSKVIFVEGSEKTKTIESCTDLIAMLASKGITREHRLVAIGGGSVQDAVTLTASLYMRGLRWCYVPTTFMSIADSCIGGKSAINVGNFKNLVGNIYPPEEIRIESSFLKTLSAAGISSGLCEAVKIQIAKGASDFKLFEEIYTNYSNDSEVTHLVLIAKESLKSKKWFIEVDEFDKKERKLLNYGHSFGHALESATSMMLPHGLAIGVGMIVANSQVPASAYISNVNRVVTDILKKSDFRFEELEVDYVHFKNALKMDKKNSENKQTLVLVNSNNYLELVTSTFEESKLNGQANALKRVLKDLGGNS